MEEKSRLAKAYQAVTGEEMPENRIHVGNLGPGDVALLKQVAEEAAHKAVQQTFKIMGMDIDNPINSQRDFAILREVAKRSSDPEDQADQVWVRQTRERMEGIFGKAVLTAIGLAVVGAAHTLWEGALSVIGKH